MIVYVNKDYLYIVDYQYTWWTILGLVYELELGPETRALVRTVGSVRRHEPGETSQWKVWFRQYLLS